MVRRDAVLHESGKLITVTGLVDADEMGITLPHEHLLLRHTEPQVILRDPDLAARELRAFRAAGGRTVVEVTNRGIGREPGGLRRIAEKSGVHVVMGSSYYKWRWHPSDMDRKTVDGIADEIIRDIRHGVDVSGVAVGGARTSGHNAPVRAGVIGEVGVSETLGPNEEKVLHASARAQIETGVAMNLHIHLLDKAAEERLRMEVLDLLEKEGVDLARVVVSHCEAGAEAVDYHERMARRGANIEYDLFGMAALSGSPIPGYNAEALALRRLIDRGCLDRILISHDVCYGRLLAANGGWGYAHILDHVVPRFVSHGITRGEISAIVEANPRRVFPVSL